jgi:C3HC4-type zinc finger (RING finger) protein/FHA domain-containing protein
MSEHYGDAEMVELIRRSVNGFVSPPERDAINSWCSNLIADPNDIQVKKRIIWEKIGHPLLGEMKPSYLFYGHSDDGIINELRGPIITVGQSPDNDIVLSSKKASALQAVIIIGEHRLLILDGWSTNGTMMENMTTEVGMYAIDPICEAGSYDQVRIWISETSAALLKDRDDCLVLNPLNCLLCRTRIRQVMFSCGHTYVCLECYDELHAKGRYNCYICGDSVYLRDIGVYCDGGELIDRENRPISENDISVDPLKEILKMYGP